MAANGRKWPQVAAGRKASLEQVHGSHLQPPEWPQVAQVHDRRRLLEQVSASGASGGRWLQVAAAWIARASLDCSMPQRLEKSE